MTAEMKSFVFETVPSIVVEWGACGRLGEIVSHWFGERRVLIVTDSGLHAAGVLDAAKVALSSADFQITVFDKVMADPPESVVTSCVDVARKNGVDLVVGIGGGSSMDIAKLVAVLIKSNQPLQEMFGIDRVRGGRIPLIQIPTTAGTGSEVTNITILTTGQTTKMGIVARQLYADHVILDAQLTVGLPAVQTAATGIDAMVHAIEAYTGQHKKNPLSDALAREALRLLFQNLVEACNDGNSRSAREAMLLGANLAGQAFSNSPVGAVHALAYPLGGYFHIPHGLSNALMLGPVLRFNKQVAANMYAELGDVVSMKSQGSVSERASNFIASIEELMDKSGIPRRLRDVGVKANSLATLAAEAMKQGRLLQNNPIELTERDALSLYEQAY